MRTFKLSLVAVLAILLQVAGLQADDDKIPLDKLPKAVLEAVKAKYKGAELVEASKEVEKNVTSYEVIIKFKGEKLEVTLTSDGKIEAVEREMEAKDLPKAVSDSIKAKYDGYTISKVEEVTKGETVTYEILVKKGDKKVELTIGKDGKITEAKEEK
ncbi:PepSY-like domain-containing protein [Telmatocola sphagniphila]|uniref:PepSY-like domain-containing protein n=1 Tax=Telmatocola sphagniphila TaxID=1123043 RepID=A0A8E6B4A4_9BACT|nr:PepSY-like domain-containing protein [Telmatocola sphagniphila]QVL31456.1 PepSY-like domain-containing protein [Telmatocola sphagniphila]